MFRSLSLKLVVSLTASLIVILSFFGYRMIEMQRQHMEQITFEAADRISDSIENSILYSMQRNHREHIYHTIQIIGSEPGINKIRIFNEIGRISYSSDDSEIDSFVDKRAEACYACHSQEEPLHRLERPDRRRVYTDRDGNRILGLINAIENRPQCYQAGCHAHSPDRRVLGVLDVTMSLAYVDQTINEGRGLLTFYTVLSILLVSLVLIALVWWMVHKPIRGLIAGTEKVAAGDLDHRIKVGSHDEMGALGESFNRMTIQLQQAQGELQGWANTLETRVEKKTAQLERAHQQMIQVERMASMGKLAAIVAHEINNPLSGILTSARLILRRFMKGKIKSSGEQDDTVEHVEMIAGEASRCGEIVKSLLQFARSKKGTKEPTDLNQLLRDSVRLVKHKVDLMNVDTLFELKEDIPPVLCDPQGIRQVFVAILINACEAMSSVGGVLTVGTRQVSTGSFVEAWVADTGCGMDEQTRKRIFEPFYTTKEDVKGVGLGLAVVSGIIGSHGGEIEVESEIGSGTTFFIRLPAITREASLSA